MLKILAVRTLVNTPRRWYGTSMASIRDNVLRIEERIGTVCDSVGRTRDSVRLMAVSKLQPVERIQEAIDYGLRLFGESRVQETKSRRDLFPEDAEIHLIGHLQRNKAKDAALLYHTIQSIDAERTLNALSSYIPEGAAPIGIMIEVNTSGEENKHGVEGYSDLRALASIVYDDPRYSLIGLMTIGPLTGDDRAVRTAFANLREQRDRLSAETGYSIPELSMGMSGDLEAAIREGSTMVRIGTAIFGQREY
jgi:pyridoxal phosphate enzyme (YggS family)